ncbi:MAG: hypothetical protein H6650_13325 [Ardenticatenales bacterium]|nr:hypothetical protein [Ardenticatenales bacterium]
MIDAETGARAERFLLPLRVAREVVGERMTIFGSSKLTEGCLQSNRYILDFLPFDENAGIQHHCHTLCGRLGAGERVVAQVQTLLNELGGVRFLGVAEEDNRIVYKVYLGMKAAPAPPSLRAVTGQVALGAAIGWVAETDHLAVKRYAGIPVISQESLLPLVREALFPPENAGIYRDQRDALWRACRHILANTRDPLALFLVKSTTTSRQSVDIKLAQFSINAVAHHLRDMAVALHLPPAPFADWLAKQGENQLSRLAVGSDAQGRPFITTYSWGMENPAINYARMGSFLENEPI